MANQKRKILWYVMAINVDLRHPYCGANRWEAYRNPLVRIDALDKHWIQKQ